jgi:hypothetical protein
MIPPPSDPPEFSKELMLARSGVFTVAATNPLKLDTAGERFQLLI